MKPLSVVLYGLEDQDAELFHKTFNALNDRVQRRWKWIADDSDADADLIIVDIDSIHGHMDWLKATGAGHRTAVYTVARHSKESDLIMSKPLLADELAAVLDAAAAEHAGQVDDADDVADIAHEPPRTVAAATTRAPVVDVSEPVAREVPVPPAPVYVAPQPAPKPARKVARAVAHPAAPAAQPVPVAAIKPPPAPLPEPERKEPAVEVVSAPQPSTIGEWLRIGKIEQPVCISANQQSWVLDPDRDAYHGPSTLKPMLEALSEPLERLQRADVVALESARKQPSQPLARLRWVAGLDASPGKLLPELVDATSFKLGRWPQIEREYPRHFRIATAMMKQAGSVDEITAASGAPRDEVVNFINAYHTLGYIVRQGQPEQESAAPKDGMMSRIRKPFGR